MVDEAVSDNPPISIHGKSCELHTCRRHIQRDEKSKLKGDGFGFLEKGIDCTQVFAF